ncbi:hypothetical protein KKC91_07540 [bacterium]|nr:hypothetical protein [bacterium]
MKHDPNKWMALLFRLQQKGKIEIRAIENGRFHGRIAEVIGVRKDKERENTEETKTDKIILKLLKLLATVSFTGVILKLIQGVKGKQVIGINKAEHGSGLYLYGYCLQANELAPAKDEEIQEADLNLIKDKIPSTNKWLLYTKTCIQNIFDDLVYMDNNNITPSLGRNVGDNFIQAGIWVITDDVAFGSLDNCLFGRLEFFTWQHLEIILILYKHIALSGINIRNKRIREEIKHRILYNLTGGVLPRIIVDEWQKRYGFQIVNIIKENQTIYLDLKFNDEKNIQNPS